VHGAVEGMSQLWLYIQLDLKNWLADVSLAERPHRGGEVRIL